MRLDVPGRVRQWQFKIRCGERPDTFTALCTILRSLNKFRNTEEDQEQKTDSPGLRFDMCALECLADVILNRPNVQFLETPSLCKVNGRCMAGPGVAVQPSDIILL